MDDSMYPSRYMCIHTNTYVPMWVHVCLSTFPHKHHGVSETVSVLHEPLRVSLCFCMCFCVCTCALPLGVKHILWMPRSACMCLCTFLCV